MFKQVFWFVVLSLTWSYGCLYYINVTEGLAMNGDADNGSDPVLIPVFDIHDPDLNISSPLVEPVNNTSVMSDLYSQAVDQVTTSIYPEESLISECQVSTKNELTVIKSPSFPNNYRSNMDCQYTVFRNSSRWCSVTFLFNVLDLEVSVGCSKDYIDLVGEKLCGYNPSGVTRIIQFQDSKIVMKFHSDEERSGLGFLLTAVQEECPPPSCDKKLTDSNFKLSSPNFPSNYENRRICDYVIVKKSTHVCKLRLQVTLFDVEYDDRCEADFFELDGEKFCGIMSEGQIGDIVRWLSSIKTSWEWC
ncbi:CUB domain-containing protein 2-like isoform X2 [Limulus polyphemus]|uniref:CUB domain-containing protein 2-like isoform X2 n=1 Tax=Limulus polyphemus TaxID=6850 RepID=A0ABM1T922_LIMPO|nr:CUB domain-containing protein 2-like isoform X2 [Limulus polyphemus]